MPKRSPQQRAGCSGEAFVDKAVSGAGRVWDGTRRDFGIGGHIEFVATDGDLLTLGTAHRVGAFLRQVPPDAHIAIRYT